MEYLPKTQASLRAQTMKDVEVLVLCNGSPPEGRAFVDAWRAADANVTVLRSDPRIPMFENFNLGIRAAKTPYVTFFHDDDEYRPDFLEKTVAFLESHPSVGLAGSNLDCIDQDGNVTEERRWVPEDTILGRGEYIEKVISRGRNIIAMPGLVYRREILGDGFDVGLPIHWGDFVLLMQYAEKADIAILNEPLLRMRRHAQQASSQVPMSRAAPMRTRLLLEYLDGYLERFPGDAAMVRRLRRRLLMVERVSLVWGWVSAPSNDEGNACLDALPPRPLDRALAASLRTISAVGLRPHRGSTRAITLARQVAERLGF
jgi:glycosyltransferase involved in cell wall biosynthesis